MSTMQLSKGQRRLAAVGVGALAVLVVGVGVGVATAGTDAPARPAAPAVAGTVVCPSVADRLPVVPAAARAEVDQNLAALDKQVAEANQRLVTSAGQGGPAFVDNAILGPLASKRGAVIERIAIAIGRHAPRPTGLESLATCAVSTA